MGGSPRRPPYADRKLESLFIIYRPNGVARREPSDEDGARGGYGVPRALTEKLGRYFVFLRVLFVFMPPAGGAGGSELSDGPTRAPKREGRGRTARAGGGWGRGKFVLIGWIFG